MQKIKLKRLLDLWQKNNLIDDEQVTNILNFMQERNRELFFKFLKWLMIFGAFWLVFGSIVTIINIIEINFFHKIFIKLASICSHISNAIFVWIIAPIVTYVIQPICSFIESIFGENRVLFYIGTYSLFIATILGIIHSKIKPKSFDNLNISEEQKNILQTNWVIDTAFCIFLTGAFSSFNILSKLMFSGEKMVPVWDVIGTVIFVGLAYKYEKTMFLIFGIYFFAAFVGIFTGYDSSIYWLSITRPTLQIIIGIFLLLIAYISKLKFEAEPDTKKYYREKFANIYNATGLLFIFLALWIASIWGFDFEFAHHTQIWLANILFIAASVGAMYFGTKSEQKIFFYYGLTFLFIETYTVFCSRLCRYLPAGVASLILGILLIITAKTIKKIYIHNIQKQNR